MAALPAIAQPRVVGVLAIGSPESGAALWDGLFGGGLRELGYKGDRALTIEYRWARGDLSRYPALARDLMKHNPEVIFAPCGPSLKAIRDISRTIPVIVNCADESNFLGEVASLPRPGGYTTGITFFSPETVGKRIQLLREIIPGLTRLAVLYEPDDPIPGNWRELQRLQPLLKLSLQHLPVRQAADLVAAFESAARERAQAVYVFPTNLLVGQRLQIAELTRKYRLATIAEFGLHADAGVLLAYGASVDEWLGKTVPMYVDRILKGAKPGDLPIIQPSKLELVVNVATARMIGVKIPQSVLLRADRVID